MRTVRFRPLFVLAALLVVLVPAGTVHADPWADFISAQEDHVALTALHAFLTPYGSFVAEEEGSWDVGNCNLPDPLGTIAAAAAMDVRLIALRDQLDLAEGHLDDAHTALLASDWTSADYYTALAEIVLDEAYDIEAVDLVTGLLERAVPHGAVFQAVPYAIPLHELDNVQWINEAEVDILVGDVPVANTSTSAGLHGLLNPPSSVPFRGRLVHREGVVIRDPLVIDLDIEPSCPGQCLVNGGASAAHGSLPYVTGVLDDVRLGDIAWLPSGSVIEFPTLAANFEGQGCELPLIPITPQPGAEAPACGCTQMCTGFGGFLGSLILTGSLGLQGGGFYPNPDCLLINTIFTHFRTRETLETIHIDVLESTPEGFRDALLQWEMANLSDFRASIEAIDPQLFDALGDLLTDLGTPPDPLEPHHISFLSAPTGGSGCGGGPPGGGGGGGGGGTWPGAEPVCENTCAIDRPQCGSVTPGSLPGNGCGRVLLDPMGSCLAGLSCGPEDIGGLTGHGHIAPDGFYEAMKGMQGCWNFVMGGDPQDIASCASTNPSHQETMTQLCNSGSPFCSGTVLCPGDGTTGETCRVCHGTSCIPINPRGPGYFTQDPATEEVYHDHMLSAQKECDDTTSTPQDHNDCMEKHLDLAVELGICSAYTFDPSFTHCETPLVGGVQEEHKTLPVSELDLVVTLTPSRPPQAKGQAVRTRRRPGRNGSTGSRGATGRSNSQQESGDQDVEVSGAGDPVMLNTGGLMMTATDLHSHGDESFAVSLHRRYNSHGRQVGVLGRNWTSILDERLTIPVGQSGGRRHQARVPPLCTMWPGATLCLLYHDGGGGTTLYVWDQTREIFVPEAGNAGVIVTVTDPAPLIGLDSGLMGLMYAHRAPNGTTTLFDLRGTKRARISATGNVTRFHRGESGQIEQIITADGFVIEFVYGLWGLLESAHSVMGSVYYTYGINVEVEGELQALDDALSPEEANILLDPHHEESQYRRRLASPWNLRELIDALATAGGAHWDNPTITPETPYSYTLLENPGVPDEAKRVFARLEEVRFEPPSHGNEARITRYEYELPPPIDVVANTPDIARCLDNALVSQADTGQCGTQTAVSRDCASLVMRTISNQPFEHSYISRVSRREEGASAASEMVVGTVIDGWIIELENAWGWRDDRTAQVIVQRYGPSIDWDPVDAVNGHAAAASDSVTNAQPSWWTGSAVIEVSGAGSLAAMQSDSPVIEFRYLTVRELDMEDKSFFGLFANAVATANARMGRATRAEGRPLDQGGTPPGIGLSWRNSCDDLRVASPAYELTWHGITSPRWTPSASGAAALQEALVAAATQRTQNANLICDVALVRNGNDDLRVVGLNAFGATLIDIEDVDTEQPSINAQVVNGDGYSEVELLANGVVRHLSRLGGLEEHPLRRGLVVYEIVEPRPTIDAFAWLPTVLRDLLEAVPPVVRTMDYEPLGNRIVTSTLNDSFAVEHIYEYQRSASALEAVESLLELFGFTGEDDVLPPLRTEAGQTGSGHFHGLRPLPVRLIETDDNITITHEMEWNIYGQLVLQSGPGIGEVTMDYGNRSSSSELPDCPSTPSLCNVATPLLTTDWASDPSLPALGSQGGSVDYRTWEDVNPLAGQVYAPSTTTRTESILYDDRMLPIEIEATPGGTTELFWSPFGELDAHRTPAGVNYLIDRDGRGRVVRVERSSLSGNDPSIELLHRTVRSPTGIPVIECVSNDASCDACVAAVVSGPSQFLPSACQRTGTRLTRIGRDGRGRVTGVVDPEASVTLTSYSGSGSILSASAFANGDTSPHRHVELAYGSYGDLRSITQVATSSQYATQDLVHHVAEDGFGRAAATRIGHDGPWHAALEHPAPTYWPYRFTAEYFGGLEDTTEVLYSRTDTYRTDGGRPIFQFTWDAESEATAPDVASSGVTASFLSPSHPLLGSGSILDLRGHGLEWDTSTGHLERLTSLDQSVLTLDWTSAGMLAREQLWSADASFDPDELLQTSVRAWDVSGTNWTLNIATNAPGGVDVFQEIEHDVFGRPVTFWTFDADGQISSSHRVYDALHRTIAGTDEQGTGWSVELDGFGQPLLWSTNSIAGATGLDDVQKTWTYDVMGRVEEHVDELGRTFGWSYNTRGQLTTESRPWATNWRNYDYDGLGRLAKIERHGEHDIEFTYWEDSGGIGQIQTATYLDQSQVDALMGFAYGGSGRLRHSGVLRLNDQVLTSVSRSGSGHPVSETTEVTVGSQNVMDVTTTWHLDGQQRPTFWHSDRGVSQEIDWGSAGRAMEVRQCHGPSSGSGCAISSPALIATWSRGWVGMFNEVIDGYIGFSQDPFLMGRSMDARGRVNHMAHMTGTNVVAEHRQLWGSDERVRLETLVSLAPEHVHDSVTTDWRGISRAYDFSGQGFLEETAGWEWYADLTTPPPTYWNITQVTSPADFNGGPTQDWSGHTPYDVSFVRETAGTLSDEYTGMTQTWSSTPSGSGPQAWTLPEAFSDVFGAHNLQWDAAGRLFELESVAADRTTTIDWCPTGYPQLLQSWDGSTLESEELRIHDIFGRNVVRVVDGTVVERVWVGDQLVGEWTECGSRILMPDVELDRILGWEVEWNVDCGVLNDADPSVFDLNPEILPSSGVFSAQFQLVQDLDGSPLVVLDESGTPVEFLRHDPYGAFERVSLVPGQSSDQCESSAAQGCPSFYGNPIGYKGSLYHGWTNLNEMRHRLYSSDMRQFLSMDPLGLIDSVDEWLFVRGDPINFSDPFGLAAEMATTPTGLPAWDPLIESSPETRAMEQEVWGGGHGGSNPLAGVPRQVGPIWPAPRLDGGIQPATGVPDENLVTLASDQVRSVEECMSLGGGQAFQRCMGGTHTSQDQLRRQHEAVGEHMEENRTGYTVDIASAGLWPAILGGLATLSRLRGLWRSNPLSRRDVRRIANEYGTTPERAQLLERVIQRDGSINVSQTVARQLAPGGSRSHIPTQSILATIGSGTRTADPQGVAGQFMYRAPARFNDGSGTLEVLVDEVSGQVRHVLYAR